MASSSSMTAASEHGVGAWLGVPQGLLRLTRPSLEGERVFTSESITLLFSGYLLMAVVQVQK